MAWDVVLREFTRESGRPVLRFYTWNPPALSLGHAQQADETVDWDFCSKEGIDVVRRPTGGRGVLHHRELTYCLTGILGQDPFPRRFQDAYTLICRALVRGFQDMKIPATLWETGEVQPHSPRIPSPCFTLPSPGEIAVDGRKIVGSAMAVRQGAFLQHGSILVGFDERLQRGVTKFPFHASVSTVSEVHPRLNSHDLIVPLTKALEATLHLSFQRDNGPTDLEMKVREIEESFRVKPGTAS
ncbi:MAG TPA: hypothetical protein PK014_00155 [Thermoanaerobaculia bacterium]|nr:hypothetical protein [Thermoanaerobaculia bacterium]